MAESCRGKRGVLLGAILGLSLLGTGCFAPRGGGLMPPNMPGELRMVAHPPHVVEPGDTLILALRSLLLPKPPYRIRTLDELRVSIRPPGLADTLGAEEDVIYIVEPDGMIRFSGRIGAFPVAGKTLDEASEALRIHLVEKLYALKTTTGVLMTLNQGREMEPLPDTTTVRPDGTISLGAYGAIHVAGMTDQQARVAIEEHLAEFLLKPELSLEVSTGDFKSFYLIVERGAGGHSVSKVALSGKDHVLNIIANMDGIPSNASGHRIWIARPAPAEAECDQILVVNWNDIVQRGRTATNFQVLPNDRLYIKADPWIAFDEKLGKYFAPFSRISSFISEITNTEELVRSAANGAGLYSQGLFGFGFGF